MPIRAKTLAAEYYAPRQWVLDANEGIITTAGALQGFSGAGADEHDLIMAAVAMVVSGALSLGGAKWAEDANERDAEAYAIHTEEQQLRDDPAAGFDQLVGELADLGMSEATARLAAEEVTANDPLAAHMELVEHIDHRTPRWQPIWSGFTSGLSFFLGGLIPLLVTHFVSARNDAAAVAAAVIVSLAITSFFGSHRGHMTFRRVFLRAIIVGVGAMGISFGAGWLLF